MQHDLQLRAAARAIYDHLFLSAEPTPVPFDEAERFGTEYYRQSVGAARDARSVLTARDEQLLFAAFL